MSLTTSSDDFADLDTAEAYRRREVLFITVSSLENLLNDATRRATALEVELARVNRLGREFEAEMSARAREIEELRRTIDEIHASTSWRITNPLREVSLRLRRRRPD